MENPSVSVSSSVMGIFTNGVTANDETSRKRGLENGDFPVKFKRRKVSAIRDFPEGCGSFAPLLFDAKPIETLGVVGCSTESLEVGAEGVCVIVEGEKSLEVGSEGVCVIVEDEKSLEVGAEGVSVIVEDEKVLINPSLECSVEFGGDIELGKTSDTIESVKLEEGMNDDEALEGMEIVEPVVMEILKDLDVVNDASPLVTIEAESTNTLKNLDKVELLDSVKDFDGSESNSLLENGSQPAEIDLPESPMDADLPLTSNVLDNPQTSGLVESIHKCYPHQRRVFVIRDFPPGCGRNAPELSKEERLKLINSSKKPSDENEDSTEENRQFDQMIEDDAREIRENVQDGNGFKRKPKGNVFKVRESFKNQSLGTENSIGKSRQLEQMVEGDDRKGRANVPDGSAFKSKLKGDDKEITHSGRSGKEPLKLSKDSSFKSKLPDDSEDESLAIVQSQGEGLQPPSERVIVQALMAAPYCPWRQGKRGFKSPPPRGPTEGGKGKKHDMHGNSKFLPKKNDGKGNSEEKSAKRKMPPTGKDAYQCSDNQVIVWDEHDTPGHDENDESSGTTGGKRKKHHNRNEKKDGAGNSKENSTERKMSSVGKDAYEYINEQHVVRDEYDSPGHDDEDENFALVPRAQGGSLNLIPFGLHMFADKDDSSETIVTRNKVRETLRLFQAIFRKLLRDEEAKSKEQGNKFKRVDLISASILKEKNKWVNTGKPILGPVPGVEVGDEFHYRVELSIIGLHHPFQGGIDYLRKGNRIVATSIVASGGHDEMDSSDVLIYSGQGGNPVGKEKQAEDQKLERGNLALKNSLDESSPVRVIRGFKETKGADNVDTRAKVVATYIYDGLYLVERYWQEKGRYGANVFMFRLRRIPGQPELAFKEVKKLKKLRVGICVDDISQGKEKMPICAINTIDDEKPPPFKYITSMIYPSWYKPMPPKGCECTNGCSDSEKCLCAVKNGGEILFNYNGAIVEAKSLVYECGPLCKCPPSCHNRVSQHGIKFQLEIFKTELRGWGVRSLTSIPSGSFICEYTGELLEDKEAEKRTGNDEYLFDIGNNYNDGTLWDGLSSLIPPDLQSSSSCETVEDVGFTIDALKYGSVGRFINHSCSPNLYAQNVVYDHDDKRMPHIMLFAAENIPPLQELTYHYNYVLDQVLDSDGNIKKKKCYCGSHACSGRLY